jgi:perosamine synthetase
MAKRQQIFAWYQKHLGSIEGISLNRTSHWASNAYWLICLENQDWDLTKRDQFMLELKKRGVDSRPFFYPMSDMPYLKGTIETPITHQVYQKGINLPTYYDLTEDQVGFVCSVVKSLLNA